MESDRGIRVTIPLRIGIRNARIYHTALIVLGWACLVAFNLMRFPDPWHWTFIVTLPLFIIHLRGVWTMEGRALDKMLPLLVMSTFVLSLLLGGGYMMFLLKL